MQRLALARHLEGARLRAYQRAPGSAPGRTDCGMRNSPKPCWPSRSPDASRSIVADASGTSDSSASTVLRSDGAAGARHVGIGAVGIDDARLGVGDDQPLRHRIDEGLRQFVGARARRDLHEADRGRKQIADADHGQDAEHAEQEGVAQPVAENAEHDRRAGQHDDEDDQTGYRPGPRALVDDRYRIEIAARILGHKTPIPALFPVPQCPCTESV